MVYAGDLWIQLPVKDLYDTLMMAMAINAAKDMYDRTEKKLDNFYEKYGDFMSPFSKDMQRYNEIVGGVRNTINQAYANGIDVLRSPEGRALVSQAIRSVNPAEISAMRANAKMGYAYLDALQALRKAGKFSKEQEDFDIALSGGTPFQDFATSDGLGGYNSWDRSSPIQATSLRELTYDSYKGRTARTLTPEDFKNDPRLAGKYAYDPRYEYTGYLDSDLLKNAPGASASLAGDPRAAFFREQARQMVIASGKEPTAENVEAQFQRNIADANTWALIDPTRKADEYAKLATEFSYNNRLRQLAHKDKMDEIAAKGGGELNPRYSATTNMVVDSEGALRGQLMNYASKKSIRTLDFEEAALNSKLQKMMKNPKKYSESEVKDITTRILNSKNRRISVGLEGVANEIVKLANKATTTYFTNRPEDINTMLRDLSSVASSNTVYNLLSHFGTKTSDNGIALSRHKNRLCGVGEVMDDVLSRGYADGVKHPSIDNALKQLRSGDLSKYRKSWTAGAFDVRNETDDAGWYTSGQSEFWPTGNVVTGDKYYYIEVSNDPSDGDECCWFKVERDKAHGGGINPVLSSITQDADDSFMKTYSNSNVIGNQLSTVREYNK